ncbi:MAG: hypothetical protein AB9856_00930 [Cellulosilyticaceae bacterium]
MSLCVVVKNKSGIYICVDSAVCIKKNGKIERIGYTDKKIIKYKDNVIFMGGKLQCALLTKKYIEQNGLDNLQYYLQNELSTLVPKGEFNQFIAIINKNGVTKYQMINHHEKEFEPFESGNGMDIRAYGMRENEVLKEIERLYYSKTTDLETLLLSAYKKVAYEEVGGYLFISDLFGNGKLLNIDADKYKIDADKELGGLYCNTHYDITVGRNIYLQDQDDGITGIHMSENSDAGLLFNHGKVSLNGDGVGLSSRGSIHLSGADIHLDAHNVMIGNDHVATREWVETKGTVARFG